MAKRHARIRLLSTVVDPDPAPTGGADPAPKNPDPAPAGGADPAPQLKTSQAPVKGGTGPPGGPR